MPDQSLLDHACAKIGDLGHRFYFDPATLAVGRQHNLDGFRFYFLGRGGVLGDVEPRVVDSAFGYFNPALVERIWNSAKERLAPRKAGRLYVECCQAFGRARLADLPGLGAFCEAAAAVDAAVDPAGLTLYAGLSAEPLATDVPARAMQLLTLLREFRGSAHLVAVVALGMSPRMAHGLRRPDAGKMFGWEDAPPSASDGDVALLARVDALTDALVGPAYEVIGDEGLATMVAVIDAMEPRLLATA